jgi:hypothetical protein
MSKNQNFLTVSRGRFPYQLCKQSTYYSGTGAGSQTNISFNLVPAPPHTNFVMNIKKSAF